MDGLFKMALPTGSFSVIMPVLTQNACLLPEMHASDLRWPADPPVPEETGGGVYLLQGRFNTASAIDVTALK